MVSQTEGADLGAMTVKEFCRKYRIGRTKFYEEIKSGRLRAVKWGARTLVLNRPIWLYEGKILDGRNRWRAAQQAGVDCPERPYNGDDPLGFVISANLKRRHMAATERASVAARFATFKHGGNRQEQAANLPLDPPRVTQAEAAKRLNVSECEPEFEWRDHIEATTDDLAERAA